MFAKNKIKKILVRFAVFSLAILVACTQKDKKFAFSEGNNLRIAGTITGGKGQRLYLETASQDGVMSVADVLLENDDFELQTNIPGLGIYQLRLGESPENALIITADQEDNIILKSSSTNFVFDTELSEVSWSQEYNEYMALISEFSQAQSELMAMQESSSQEELIARYLELKKPLDNFARKSIKKRPESAFNIVLSESLMPSVNGFIDYPAENLELLKKMYASYQQKYADSPFTRTLGDQVAQIESGISEYELIQSGKKIAPDILLNSPEGKQISLASTQGKLVLIDFWASWCGPCRRENPNVVKLYNKYKDKGFTIYSVSLDSERQKWIEAIEQDGLIWPYHVSDLKQWESPMIQLYKIKGIPHTVLVGKDGYVIAEGLRGQALENKVAEILNLPS